MQRTFTIMGRFPTLNEYLATARRSPHAENRLKHEALDKIASAICRACPCSAFTCPVNVHFTFFEHDKKRDKDNVLSVAAKFILDGMQTVGLIQNDGWNGINSLSFSFEIDSQFPRIEVVVADEEIKSVT